VTLLRVGVSSCNRLLDTGASVLQPTKKLKQMKNAKNNFNIASSVLIVDELLIKKLDSNKRNKGRHYIVEMLQMFERMLHCYQ
jgi:hypothetical protein